MPAAALVCDNEHGVARVERRGMHQERAAITTAQAVPDGIGRQFRCDKYRVITSRVAKQLVPDEISDGAYLIRLAWK
jgi:hypothetical protein